MATYPNEAYKPAFNYYNTLPTDVKRKADEFMTENYAKGRPSPEQMQKDLETIVAKHQPKAKSAAGAPTSSEIFHDKGMQYAGLAVAAMLLLYLV